VVHFSDITERKRTEQMLKASEERYRRLFDDALDGICLVEEQSGMILDCNPALLKLVAGKSMRWSGIRSESCIRRVRRSGNDAQL